MLGLRDEWSVEAGQIVLWGFFLRFMFCSFTERQQEVQKLVSEFRQTWVWAQL